MPSIQWDTLEVSGFKSYYEPQKLKLSKLHAGLHFVRGRNEVEPRLGANDVGKSSLWGAVTWILYGKTVEGARNPDIIPWGDPDSTVCGALRLVVDGKPQVIARTANPNAVTVNGERVGDEKILDLIGINFEVFTNTILLGQGQPLFFDRTRGDKLALLSDTLGYERWEARSALASDECSRLQKEKLSIEAEGEGVANTITEVTRLLDKAKEASAIWEKARSTLVKDYAKDIAALQEPLEVKEKNLAKALLEYDSAGTELKSLDKQLETVRHELTEATACLRVAEHTLQTDKDERRRLAEELAAFGKADKCPICEQPIKGTKLAKHKLELQKEIDQLDKTVKAGVPAKVLKAKEAAAATLLKLLEAERKFKARIDTATSTIDVVQPEIAEIKAKIRHLQQGQQQHTEAVNPHHEQLLSLRRKVRQLEADQKTIAEDLEAISARIERNKFWVQEFKNVRLHLIEEFLQEFEITTNATIEELGLVGWRVEYATERETKKGTVQRGVDVTITSPRNNRAVPWAVWGGGVGQRLRLIGALALSEVLLRHAGVETDLEILDEPTRHLSVEGRRDLCSYLAARARDLGRATVYCDHTVVDSADFASTIMVVKDKSGSRIE